jgi:hypothetical protein
VDNTDTTPADFTKELTVTFLKLQVQIKMVKALGSRCVKVENMVIDHFDNLTLCLPPTFLPEGGVRK